MAKPASIAQVVSLPAQFDDGGAGAAAGGTDWGPTGAGGAVLGVMGDGCILYLAANSKDIGPLDADRLAVIVSNEGRRRFDPKGYARLRNFTGFVFAECSPGGSDRLEPWAN